MTTLFAEWLVWLTPLIASPLVPIISRLSRALRGWFAVAAGLVATIMSVLLLSNMHGGAYDTSVAWLPVLGLQLEVHVDGLSVFMAVLVNTLGFLILVYSQGYMAHEEGLDRYYALMLLFIGSMTGLVMAGNLLQLYIFWELVGICSCFLIAFWYDRPEAVKAGLKAFFVTRLGDVALLIGLVTLYSGTGAINIQQIASLAANGSLGQTFLLMSGILVFVGAMGKSAQVPLQVWLPDAMEGPTTVSALIHAATMVNAGVYLAARTFPIFSINPAWLITVGSIGMVTALIAAASAAVTLDVKRVLAYSTISQLGLMFTALSAGTAGGWFASQFHLLSQGVFKALAFLAAGSVIHVLETRNMEEMGGLRRSMPLTFLGFLFAVVAMSGVPPFIGFWSKDLVLGTLLSSGAVYLFVGVVAVSILTAFYSFRALFKVFFGEPTTQRSTVHESPAVMTLPLIVLSAGVTILGFTEGQLAGLLGVHEATGIPTVVYLAGIASLRTGFGSAYILYYRRRPSAERLISNHPILSSLRQFALSGFGFDRFYDSVFVRPAMRLASAVTRIQTGILAENLWGFLVFLLVVLLVIMGWAR